jgi:hypothetical protein
MINDDFGLPVANKSKIALIKELNDFLIEQYHRGNQPVLIIDEAQNLPLELLEEIRMLSNLETESAKLLQIVLVGQPELRETLALPAMVQLRQRIAINCHIHPLDQEETGSYILHRLEQAGDRNAVSFSAETLAIIYRYSRGIPRLINIICDFLLLAAFAEQTTVIDAGMVREVIGDLDFENHFWSVTPPAIAAATPAEQAVALRFEELNERLERLGRCSLQATQRIYQEMDAKIRSLERSLRCHQEGTSTVISDLQRRVGQALPRSGFTIVR